MDDKVLKVLSRLQRQCVAREYCVKDIRDKAIKALEGDVAAAEEVVSSLVADRFVDDSRYASAFAREKSSLSGWGSVKISFMLKGKGISSDIVAEALKDVDCTSAQKRLDSLAFTKYKSLKDDPHCRLKLLKFLMGRGYSYDEAERAASKAMSELSE